MIFKGIRTSIAKKFYFSVIFQGGARLPQTLSPPPPPPSGFAHVMGHDIQRGFANNTDVDQPAYPHSLISTFVIRFSEITYICKLATGEILIFKLVSVADESGLKLALGVVLDCIDSLIFAPLLTLLVFNPEDSFCRVEDHIGLTCDHAAS